MLERRKKWLLLSAPPVLGTVSLLFSPLTWFFGFTWDWIFFDNVIALGNLDRKVWSGSSPFEAFCIGFFMGLFASIITYISDSLDR
jgi:hypothetical protein